MIRRHILTFDIDRLRDKNILQKRKNFLTKIEYEPLHWKSYTSVPKCWKKSTSLLQAIESRIMDRFWCSSCLNNSINLPDMIGSLASGANTSLMAKNRTMKNFSNVAIFDHNFVLCRGRNWLYVFSAFFLIGVSSLHTKNFKSIGAKLRAWRRF